MATPVSNTPHISRNVSPKKHIIYRQTPKLHSTFVTPKGSYFVPAYEFVKDRRAK